MSKISICSVWVQFTTLQILISYIKSQTHPTCQPPEIINTELSWYGLPAEDPYVFYTIPNQQLSWNDAGKFCYSLASSDTSDTTKNTGDTTTNQVIALARIMDKFENNAILKTAQLQNPNSRKVWISGNALRNNSNIAKNDVEWRWFQLGQQENKILYMNYTNWGTNEPNDNNLSHDSLAFATKEFSEFIPGDWFSRSSENEEYFVCEFRCEDNSDSDYDPNLIFSSGREWIVPKKQHDKALIGVIDLPPTFEVSFEAKIVKKGGYIYPLTVGCSSGWSCIYDENTAKNNVSLPEVHLYSDALISYLSTGSYEHNFCLSYTFFDKELNLNQIYKIDYKFYSNKIEVYFDNMINTICQIDASLDSKTLDQDLEGLYTCQQANDQDSSFYYGSEGNYKAFAYEPKANFRVPIYAGRATNSQDDDSYDDGAVRSIKVYEMEGSG